MAVEDAADSGAGEAGAHGGDMAGRDLALAVTLTVVRMWTSGEHLTEASRKPHRGMAVPWALTSGPNTKVVPLTPLPSRFKA